MAFIVIPNKSFLADLKALSKKYVSAKDDVDNVVSLLKLQATSGQPLGKDCYKIRVFLKSKGRGTGGGAGLITCVKIIKNTIYLLAIYDKASIENISDKELINRMNEIQL